ncbi:MAG: diguanylate cyclase [Telluria sp.]
MIDIKTFMLVLAIGNIGFAILMAGYAGSARHGALRVWSWAKLVLGLAHLMGWLSGDAPPMWLTLASNTALIAGFALEVAAYCTFFGFHNWKRILYGGTGAAVLAYYALRLGGAPPGDIRALLSCIVLTLAGAMAWVLLRPGAERSLLRRIIGINDLIFFVVMLARAYTGAVPDALPMLSAADVQAISFITGYVLMIVNGFGFVLLCKEKDDRDMALLATTDSLTGLVNRRAFFERTEAARVLAARMRKPISLMMLDIDHFKTLNDRFGHACGDEALCVFAQTSMGVLRDNDLMGRLGGEEFALALPGTDLAGALQAAERLRAAVERAVLPKHGYSMTVSIGVVLVDPDEHINAALARADHALYQAKSGGRNRVECGEPLLRYG